VVGEALAEICTLINPRWIVLAGPMSRRADFIEEVRRAIDRKALPQSAKLCDLYAWSDLLGAWRESNSSEVLGSWPSESGYPSPEVMGGMAHVIDELGDGYLEGLLRDQGFLGGEKDP
jgi:hypothetical protein